MLGYPNALPIRIFYRRIALGAALLAGRGVLKIGVVAWGVRERGEWDLRHVIACEALETIAAVLTAWGIVMLAGGVCAMDRRTGWHRRSRWCMLGGMALAVCAAAAMGTSIVSAGRGGALPPLLEAMGIGPMAVVLDMIEMALLVAAFMFLQHVATVAPRARLFPEMLLYLLPAAMLGVMLWLLRAALMASLILPRSPVNPETVTLIFMRAGPWLAIVQELLVVILWVRLWRSIRRLKRRMYAIPGF
jgi:hypothetical protein